MNTNICCYSYAVALQMHKALSHARPEAICIVHAHTPHGIAFSTFGGTLRTYTQDSCIFHNDIAYHQSYSSLNVSLQQAKSVIDTLSNKKAIILKNHGLMTVGTSIESALYWFVMLEYCCRVQMSIRATEARAGSMFDASRYGFCQDIAIEPSIIDDRHAMLTHDQIGIEAAGHFMGSVMFDAAEKEHDERVLHHA